MRSARPAPAGGGPRPGAVTATAVSSTSEPARTYARRSFIRVSASDPTAVHLGTPTVPRAEAVVRSAARNEREKAARLSRCRPTSRLGLADAPAWYPDAAADDRRPEVVFDVLGDCPEAWALVYRHGLDGLGRGRSYRGVGELLGVGRDAAAHLVAKAYRRLARLEAAGRVPY